MRKMKVVQIGVGHDHAPEIFNSLLYQTDVFDVVGFAVPPSEEKDFPDRIEKYRDEKKVPLMSVEEALSIPDLDGAVIETEEVNLTKYAIMAAEKGLHIHMDKPGGLELRDFEKLVNILKEKNLEFSLGYMYRFNKAVLDAMTAVKNGDLGEVYCIEAHMDCIHPPEKKQWLDRFPGGMTFYLGCHLIDLIYRIQGEPEKVIPFNTCTNIDCTDADDFGMVMFKYKNGYSFAKTCAAEYGGFMRRQFVICGSKGTIEIKPFEAYDWCGARENMYTVSKTVTDSAWDKQIPDTRYPNANRYDNMMKNYADISIGNKENPYSYEYELNLFKLLLKACGKDEEQ